MTRGTTDSRVEQFRKLSVMRLTCLKYVGLWALDSNSPAFLRYLYHVYNKFVLAIILVFMVSLFADICSSFDDLSIVTDDGCIFAGIVVVFCKVMLFQTRRDGIVRVLDATLDSCKRLCKFPIGGEDEVLDKYLLLCRGTFYGFSVLGFCLVIALLFFVPVENGELPVRARYPFDTSVYPWHGIGYFVEACAVSFGMTAIIGMDSVLINLCNLFLVQLEILNAHFKSCGSSDGTPDGVDKRDESGGTGRDACYGVPSTAEASCGKDNYDPDAIRRGFTVRFNRSVRNHQRLLAVIDDFNEVFSAGMFVQMLSSTSMICLTGFQAASSSSLTQSQWLSKWDDALSVKTGRLLILSIIFSRKAINLKAGVFYVLSMETFTAILRGSYSFFALLSTMHSGDDQ
ncbi:PREDICTED: uncharacterized protein LOC105561004 isoform X2 [Vollenhovia emeryi]|uniref:uncharacterized protein LOC105561004 isoform X2 n=1 Tax=Vollenhovia emeryi TaxID=411798 RepID=UPI0005F5249C|nr:PREDICTED: uncharacterized protein LOC105561004 isoform X2 [Vollenhovia emeryi]